MRSITVIAIVLIREINTHSLTDRDFQTDEIHVSRFRSLIRTAFARTDRQTDRQRGSRGVVTASSNSGKKSRSRCLSFFFFPPLFFCPACSKQRCAHVEAIHAEGSALEIPIRLYSQESCSYFFFFWWITNSLLHEGMLPIFQENLFWMSSHSTWISTRWFHRLSFSFFLFIQPMFFPLVLTLILVNKS